MSDSNRLQIAYVEESTLGTTPAISGTTVMRTARLTGESLAFNITNVVSNEIRSDRMIPDLIQAGAQNSGGLNYELSYPKPRTFLDQFLGAGLFNTWTQKAFKSNIVADTEVAGASAGTGIYTVDAGGTNFIVNAMVQASGFTNAANNGVFNVSATSATSITTDNTSSVLEAAPPVGAMLQTVGHKFGSADLVATTTGLTCTTGNFLTIGLAVGQWIKIGGTGATNQFATAANNDFARITAVSANAITLDNRPAGWAADAGTGKTVKIWFGDVIKNGTTRRSFTIEKGLLDIGQYLVYKGMLVGTVNLALTASQIITGDLSFLGTTHTASASALSGSPLDSGTEDIMSAMANVARLAEANTSLGPNNYAQSLTIQINNNLRPQMAIGTLGMIGVGVGRCDVSGAMTCYFSDRTQYDKYLAGTPTSINYRTYTAGGRAVVFTAPNVEFESGGPVAPGPNQDVLAQFGWRAKFDSLTNSQVSFDRFGYFE